MKFDKDAVLKQRFWILLGIAVPLILTGTSMLLTSVSAEIEAKKQAVEADISRIRMPTDPQNQNTINAKATTAKEAKDIQTVVWKNAYLEQKALYTWPDAIEKRFNFHDGNFAIEIQVKKMTEMKDWPEDRSNPQEPLVVYGTLKELEGDRFVLNTRNRPKEMVFHRIEKVKVVIEGKAEEKGKAPFIFANLGGPEVRDKLLMVTYQKSKFFLDPLTAAEGIEFKHSYMSQIAPLLAQVDPIRYDNKGNLVGVVQFDGWSFNPRNLPKPNKFIQYVDKEWDIQADFSEDAWNAQEDIWIQRELFKLVREANDVIAKLKPESDSDPKTHRYKFSNPYYYLTLEWDGKLNLNATITNRLGRRQRLDQDFLVKMSDKPGSSPEKIRIGGLPLEPAGTPNGTDTRKVQVELIDGLDREGIFSVEQILTWETAAVKRVDQVVFAKPEALGNRMANMSLKNIKNDPTGRTRYLEITPESRRLPVALSLIADQDHVHRVLTAFNNSRLRLLISQVVLSHCPQSMRPLILDVPPAALDPAGGLGKIAPIPIGAGRGGGGSADAEANIEVVIYGVVTLYNRYPPRAQ